MADTDRATPDSPHAIDGARLQLRDVRISDADGAYVRWMNDPEVTRYTESRFTTCSVDEIRTYIEASLKDDRSTLLAITTSDEDRHIGNIKVGSIDPYHGSADIGLIIGEKDYWGRGFGAEAIGLAAAHAFAELGLRKLTAGIYAPNTGSVRAFRKAGFTEEGLLRSQCRLDNDYVDVVLMGRSYKRDD
jgi:ribosomal-protein-alanine N-acetyltransferase